MGNDREVSDGLVSTGGQEMDSTDLIASQG